MLGALENAVFSRKSVHCTLKSAVVSRISCTMCTAHLKVA